MLVEDCYQIGSLNKKHNKTKRKTKKKISKSPQPCLTFQQPLLHNKSQPIYQNADCIKNIVQTQKQMCNTILKISHKMFQISYPFQEKNGKICKNKQSKRSKSLTKKGYQFTIKNNSNSNKDLNFNQLSNIQQVKEQQQLQSSTPIKQNQLNAKIGHKIQNFPQQFKNNDYFVSGMVKNAKGSSKHRPRSISKKQKSLSKVSKSSSIDSAKTCGTCKSKQKQKYRPKNKSVNNFFTTQKKWKK